MRWGSTSSGAMRPARPPTEACPGGLSTPKLRRTTAYIEAHLAQELSVRELAAVAQTSPANGGDGLSGLSAISP